MTTLSPTHPRRRFRSFALCAVIAGAVAASGLAVATAQAAAAGCRVAYTVPSQWGGGFTGNVSITNLGDPITSWRLVWNFTAGQQVTQAWGATATTSGSQVTAVNVDYNGALGTNATVAFGFNGSWAGSNPAPTSFALNGVTCTGATTP